MQHVALPTNLLTALGAVPHLHRPNFAIRCQWYPPDVRLALVPFGEAVLRHFMYLGTAGQMPEVFLDRPVPHAQNVTQARWIRRTARDRAVSRLQRQRRSAQELDRLLQSKYRAHPRAAQLGRNRCGNTNTAWTPPSLRTPSGATGPTQRRGRSGTTVSKRSKSTGRSPW